MKKDYEKPEVEIGNCPIKDSILASDVGVEWNDDWGDDFDPYPIVWD